MKIKHLRFHLGLGLAIGTSLSFLGITPPVQAQNSSDSTGTIITTSDGVGFGRKIKRGIAFRTARIEAAVNQAAASLNAQLAAGTLPVITRGVGTTSISPTVQQAFASILTGTGNVDANIDQLAIALSNSPNSGISPQLARNLFSSFRGLTAGGRVDPVKLRDVVRAYNALINASGESVLTNPPEGLLAIQSVLAALLNAALTAA